jgi:hypothetical protein
VALVRFDTPWDSQPQEAVEVDWGNPISSGLVAASIEGGNPRDPTVYTNANGFTPGVSLPGRVANILAASTQNFEYSGPNRIVDAPFTIVTLASHSLNGGALFTAFESVALYHELYITGPGAIILLSDGGANAAASSSAGAAIANEWAVYGGRVDSASSRSVWKNGRLLASNTTTTGAISAASNRWGTWNGTTERMTGAFALRLAWKRALSDAEMSDISSKPWQLFAPRQIWIPATAAASFNPTLSLPTYVPGSLTSSAFRPRVTATWS